MLVTSLGWLAPGEAAPDFDAQLSKPLKASQLHDVMSRVLQLPHDEEAPATTTGSEAGQSTIAILLVEDGAVNQTVALNMLTRLGHQADVAWNGLEALEALEQHPYDVVLMDVQMPELDGLDATRRIRERWPDGGPHIIAMTANAMTEDREECLAAGMDDYLAKPIRLEVLAGRWQRRCVPSSTAPRRPPGLLESPSSTVNRSTTWWRWAVPPFSAR